MSVDESMLKIKQIQRDWINNFRLASIQDKLKEPDGWLRNRLRYCIWHDWKKRERKRKNLIRLGSSKRCFQMEQEQVRRLGNSPALSLKLLLQLPVFYKEGMNLCLFGTKRSQRINSIQRYFPLLMNRPIRGPYAGWYERLSPSIAIDGAVYSISCS